MGKVMPYLLFDENGNRNYIELERDLMLTLGCTPDCNIILPDSSRSHFRIFADSAGVWFVETWLLRQGMSRRPPLWATGTRSLFPA